MTEQTKKWRGLRSSIYLLIILLVVFGLSKVYFRLTDDFRIANITYEMPFRDSWEVEPLSAEQNMFFDKLLTQKFYYIGKGAQSYAFSSEDNQYVLKFFKFKHLKPSLLIDLIPPVGPLKDYKNRQIARKKRLLDSVFDGYRLAYDLHKDETGMIFIHLNKSSNLGKKILLVDKIGLEKEVNLDEIPFILQQKVQTTRTVMTDLMEKQDLPIAKKRIHQIFELYLSEYRKGIYDRDHGVMHNTGFAGDRPIHLDVGKLSKDDNMKLAVNYKSDLSLVIKRLNSWIESNYPQHHAEMNAFMDQEMHAIFQ